MGALICTVSQDAWASGKRVGQRSRARAVDERSASVWGNLVKPARCVRVQAESAGQGFDDELAGHH